MQFMRAIDLDPNYTEVHYWTGLCYEKLGEPTHAAIDFEAYLKEHPQGKYAQDAAKRLAVARQKEAAETIPRLGPSTPAPPKGKAAPTTVPATRVPAAVPATKTPAVAKPGAESEVDRAKAQNRLQLGEMLQKAGKDDSARKVYLNVIELYPNTEAADAARKHIEALDAKTKAGG
jgi:TolA-binding protein